ncbi:L-threonylcarbamoyladenylate synthase, partial [bacterium]
MAGIKTKTIPAENWPEHAEEAAGIVRAGGIILFPTETVYGIGTHPSATGIEKLAGMKCRAPGKPFQVLIADTGTLKEWGAVLCPAAEKLIQAFWPGPLTLALEVDTSKTPAGLAPNETIGFRIPDHELCLDLIRRAGGSLAAT